MKLLWLTWKDLENPLAGGAEFVNQELAKRLATDGHEVTLLVGGFAGGAKEEMRDGYRIIRVGNRLTVYYHAWRYYRSHLKGQFDLVIDEVNTIPFFAKFYVSEPNMVMAHMLCRDIWFYELPRPLGLIGYLLEPLYLRLLADRRVVTVSASTKQDLIRHGFKSDNISIISEGIEIEPVSDILNIEKYPQPTLLSLGSIRSMKRTLDQIKAFELAKKSIPDLRLKLAGDSSGHYGAKVLRYIEQSQYRSDIEYLGRVTSSEKIELMQRSHLILVTSVKEGWGLIVTEAASQGTPAVVYNVDGLRDSVIDNKTGRISAHNTPASLAAAIQEVLSDEPSYQKLRHAAWDHSRPITFTQAYSDLRPILEAVKAAPQLR